MSEFKGTRGNITKKEQSVKGVYDIMMDNIWIGSFHNFESVNMFPTIIQTYHNANLIVDAFKVRQQINCELSELLEMYKECFELFIPMDKWDEATEFLSTYGSGLAKNLKKKKSNLLKML